MKEAGLSVPGRMPTKTEHVVIEVDVFRNDHAGSQDMDAVWKNLCDALYQIKGVEKVSLMKREVVSTSGDVEES